MKTEDLIGALVADNATRSPPLAVTMAVRQPAAGEGHAAAAGGRLDGQGQETSHRLIRRTMSL